MSFLENLEKKLKTENRSQTTVRKIMSNIRTMAYHLNVQPIKNLDFLENISEIETKMKAYTPRSFKTYLASAFTALLATNNVELAQKYKKRMDDIRRNITAEDDSNVATEKQKERMVDFQKLEEQRDYFRKRVEVLKSPITKKEYCLDVQCCMLLCLTTMSEKVLRNQEFCKTIVLSEYSDDLPKDKNYYILSENKMIINIYKTAKQYGPMEYTLSDELGGIVKHCLNLRPKKYPLINGPFFIGQQGNSLSFMGGLQRLYTHAGFPTVTPTIIRNIVATHRTGPVIKEVKKVIETAKDFGHSVVQHVRYVRFD